MWNKWNVVFSWVIVKKIMGFRFCHVPQKQNRWWHTNKLRLLILKLTFSGGCRWQDWSILQALYGCHRQAALVKAFAKKVAPWKRQVGTEMNFLPRLQFVFETFPSPFYALSTLGSYTENEQPPAGSIKLTRKALVQRTTTEKWKILILIP